MPQHKMITIDGIRVRAEDEARYRARTGKPAPAGVLGMQQADPEQEPDPGPDGQDPADPGTEGGNEQGGQEQGEQGGEQTPAAPTPDDPGALFDPGAHTVAQVLAYLTDADETETARVLAAEAAGQGRKTIAEKGNPS